MTIEQKDKLTISDLRAIRLLIWKDMKELKKENSQLADDFIIAYKRLIVKLELIEKELRNGETSPAMGEIIK